MTTLTCVAGGGNFMTAGTWSPAQVPTAADDCVLNGTSGAVTINAGSLCRSLNLTGYTNTLTHTAAVTLLIGTTTPGAGNVALEFPASGWTYTLGSASSSAIMFVSTSATQQTINFNGKATGTVTFDGPGGTWLYTGAHVMNSTGSLLSLLRGTLNINGQTLTYAGTMRASSSNTKVLTLGAASITCVAWDMLATLLTFSGASATITLNSTGLTFNGADKTYGTVIFQNTATTVTVNGANTFGTLTHNGATSKTAVLRFVNDQIITGTLTVGGNTAINRLLVTSTVLGTARTLTAAVVTAQNVDFKDITGAGAATWDLSAITGGSGDCGGNSMKALGSAAFSPSATQTSTGTASFAWSTHGWTSRVPLPQDDVVINNAFVAGRVVTLDMPRAGKSITWAGATGTPDWAITIATTVYGSITKIGAMTQSGTTAVNFEGRGAFTFTNAGVGCTNSLIIAMVGGSLTLQDALVGSLAFTHNNGNWVDAGFATTFTTFTSNSTFVRTLTRTGSMTLTGTGAVFTVTSTGLTHSGTGSSITINETTQGTSKTFAGGGITTYGNLILSGKNIIITGANTFASLAINNIGDTTGITFPSSVINTITGNVTSTASSGNVAKIISSIPGTPATLSKTSGIVSVDYVSIQDSTATGGAYWYAGINSNNVSGNSGWIFTVPASFQTLGGTLTLSGTLPRSILKTLLGSL